MYTKDVCLQIIHLSKTFDANVTFEFFFLTITISMFQYVGASLERVPWALRETQGYENEGFGTRCFC